MVVRVQESDFSVADEIDAMRRGNSRLGALVFFVGLVREISANAEVLEMTLEHYRGMTEGVLEEILAEAGQRWQVIDALVIHRVGRLLPGEQIVLVAVASAHRREAFAACEFIIDFLKTRAPFWKREVTPSGARWIEARSADERAADRWRATLPPSG